MTALLVLAIALQIADSVTTYTALKNPKLGEGNPAVRWIIARVGLLAAMALKTALGVGIAAALYAIGSELWMAVVCAIYAFVVVNNVRLLRRHG